MPFHIRSKDAREKAHESITNLLPPKRWNPYIGMVQEIQGHNTCISPCGGLNTCVLPSPLLESRHCHPGIVQTCESIRLDQLEHPLGPEPTVSFNPSSSSDEGLNSLTQGSISSSSPARSCEMSSKLEFPLCFEAVLAAASIPGCHRASLEILQRKRC